MEAARTAWLAALAHVENNFIGLPFMIIQGKKLRHQANMPPDSTKV